MISRWLFTLAAALLRHPWSVFWVGWIFNRMSFALPVGRLRETDHWLAFHHPRPSYPVHILLVPKRAIASLAALQAEDEVWLGELFPLVGELVAELKLEGAGYRLIGNGGKYQEFPQLHFHLVSGSPPEGDLGEIPITSASSRS